MKQMYHRDGTLRKGGRCLDVNIIWLYFVKLKRELKGKVKRELKGKVKRVVKRGSYAFRAGQLLDMQRTSFNLPLSSYIFILQLSFWIMSTHFEK